jgi:C1A family cysteine protease
MAHRNLYQIINNVIVGTLIASMFAPLTSQSVFAKGENNPTGASKTEQCSEKNPFVPNEKIPVAQTQAGVSWLVTAELPPAASEAAVEALSLLQTAEVNATFTNNELTMAAQDSSVDQMRAALFDATPAWMNFLGEPIDMTIYMLADGTPVTLHMESRSSTGYIWEVIPEDGALYTQTFENNEPGVDVNEPQTTTRYEGYGATSLQNIHLSANGTGETAVHLIYRRPFETTASIRIQLKVWMPFAADIELSDPTPDVPTAAVHDLTASQSPSALAELLPKELPSSWDWRAQGIVPSVRDQGGCGSCWAFGTIGVMEAAVAKSGGGLTDLSEQYLISCNTEGWSCRGGWDSHEYNYDVLGKNQTEAGAVSESDMPYTATNGSCNTALDHPYKLDGWGFVGDLNEHNYSTTIPTYDQLKNAIYTYGPITAGVCVGSAFGSYSNGLFTKDEKSTCYYGVEGYGFYSPNHMIVIVGWNDADQSLILRNSWGASWGDGGYMQIKYGTSLIGIAPTWVTRVELNPIPDLYQPGGTTYTAKSTYSWSGTEASAYKIQVYDISTRSYKINTTVSSSYCSPSTNQCSYTPGVSLVNNKNYKWRVASDSGAWSEYKAFTVKPSINFNSQFKNDKSGWSSTYGGWTLANSNYYITAGKQDFFSSVKHVNNYADVTYEARMKRTGCPSCANGLLVRGNSSRLNKSKDWQPSYQFFYTNNGYFSVWQVGSSGASVTLSDKWNLHSAIKGNDWNNLKVVAVGSSMKFYINDILVWSGDDANLTTGQLGVGMYRDYYSTNNNLYVDWTKAVTTNSKSNNEVAVPGTPVTGGNQHQSP